MRIAVIGATGNVGTAVLARFHRAIEEHEPVRPGVDTAGASIIGVARTVPDTSRSPYAGVDWHALDVGADEGRDALTTALAGVDAVVHLAWGFQPSHREDYLRELGVGGTGRVVDAVTAAGVPHLVHMSSVGAYSPKRDDEPVDMNERSPQLGLRYKDLMLLGHLSDQGADLNEPRHVLYFCLAPSESVLGRLSGFGLTGDASGAGRLSEGSEAWARSFGLALADAAVDASSVDAIVSAACGRDQVDGLERDALELAGIAGVPLTAPKSVFGDAGAASGSARARSRSGAM